MANIVINRLKGSIAHELYIDGLIGLYPYKGEWDYDWCVEHWGTKWDLYEGRIWRDHVLYFITANGNISNALNALGADRVDEYLAIDIDDESIQVQCNTNDTSIDSDIIRELLCMN